MLQRTRIMSNILFINNASKNLILSNILDIQEKMHYEKYVLQWFEGAWQSPALTFFAVYPPPTAEPSRMYRSLRNLVTSRVTQKERYCWKLYPPCRRREKRRGGRDRLVKCLTTRWWGGCSVLPVQENRWRGAQGMRWGFCRDTLTLILEDTSFWHATLCTQTNVSVLRKYKQMN